MAALLLLTLLPCCTCAAAAAALAVHHCSFSKGLRAKAQLQDDIAGIIRANRKHVSSSSASADGTTPKTFSSVFEAVLDARRQTQTEVPSCVQHAAGSCAACCRWALLPADAHQHAPCMVHAQPGVMHAAGSVAIAAPGLLPTLFLAVSARPAAACCGCCCRCCLPGRQTV